MLAYDPGIPFFRNKRIHEYQTFSFQEERHLTRDNMPDHDKPAY